MYFEYYRDVNYLWRWHLKSNNHEIIASGEAYYNKANCLHAISLVKSSYNAPIYER